MVAEKIAENVHKAKALIGVYGDYAASKPKGDAEAKRIRKEMSAVKEEILKLLEQAKKETAKQEREVLPASR